MKNLIPVLCIVLLWTGCSGNDKSQQLRDQPANEMPEETTPLQDGLYVVLAPTDNSADTSRKPGREIQYNTIFTDSTTQPQPVRLWVDTKQYVLLDLASAPDSVRRGQRTDVLLTLTDEAGTELASFTEQRLNRQVALVIGGQAVTMYTIQSQIDDGILLIPQCTEAACEYLYAELKDNVNTAHKKKQDHDDMEHLIPPMIPIR